MTSSTPAPGTETWHPAIWLRSLVSAAPVKWPVGQSIRAVLTVAGPLLIGIMTGHTLIGMWISMGTLLMTAAEKPAPYGARFLQIAVTAPIAAAGYLLGWLTHTAPAVTVIVMTAFALLSGILSGYSHLLSVGTMQTMLIAALAIGLDVAAPYWPATLLFLVGAALYAALLAVEMAIDRQRPQRDALVAVLRSLEELARARAKNDDDARARARTQVVSALNAFDTITIASRARAQGPTLLYAHAARISRAADQLFARLIAQDASPQLLAATADRLRELSAAESRNRRPSPLTAAPGTLVRLRMLETAIWGSREDDPDAAPAARAPLTRPDRALLMTAMRLALCTALAYIAFYTLPVPHAYWVPLTVALVMKPDLGSVFARAVLRGAGTVGGAVIAIAIGLALGTPVATGIALAVLTVLLPWAIQRSYAFQALILTPIIMLLIDLVVPTDSVVDLTFARVATTFIGGAIVVVAGYLIWPSARHVRIAEPFDGALAALSTYAADVASGQSAETVADDRRTAYRKLADTRVNLQRLLSEPPPAGAEAWAWIPVVSTAEHVADHITDVSASRGEPDLDSLAALAADLSAFADAGTGAETRTRMPVPPPHAGDSADPTVRELADALANMGQMVTRQHPPRASRTHPEKKRS